MSIRSVVSRRREQLKRCAPNLCCRQGRISSVQPPTRVAVCQKETHVLLAIGDNDKHSGQNQAPRWCAWSGFLSSCQAQRRLAHQLRWKKHRILALGERAEAAQSGAGLRGQGARSIPSVQRVRKVAGASASLLAAVYRDTSFH